MVAKECQNWLPLNGTMDHNFTSFNFPSTDLFFPLENNLYIIYEFLCTLIYSQLDVHIALSLKAITYDYSLRLICYPTRRLYWNLNTEARSIFTLLLRYAHNHCCMLIILLLQLNSKIRFQLHCYTVAQQWNKTIDNILKLTLLDIIIEHWNDISCKCQWLIIVVYSTCSLLVCTYKTHWLLYDGAINSNDFIVQVIEA